MADPFEVRMRFTSQLQHLNASVTSAQKAANYALKYRDMDEDLHSCILEQLEKNNMNNRANIMYFIEHLCDIAQRENHLEFVIMMQRDILRIIDAVAPSNGSGAANIKVVKKVLSGLEQKNIFTPSDVTELEETLKERDNNNEFPNLVPAESHAQLEEDKPPQNMKQIHGQRLDRRQIEQRIEEDRERHKRLRERIWAVTAVGDVEFEKLWEESSEVGDDEYLVAEEEASERKKAFEYQYNDPI